MGLHFTIDMTWGLLILLSLSKKRPKNQSPDTWGAGKWWFSQCTVAPASFWKSVFFGTPYKCVFGFILAHWMLLSVVAVRCTVFAAQTISINDTAPVCHKLCGNGRKKLLSDWKNEIYLFAFHFSFLMWELLLGKWVVYKHYFRGEKLNTDDRHVSNLPTPILDTSR